MKKTNILFWVFTGLWSVFMILTSIPDVMKTPEAIDMVSTKLGYPQYFLPFIGIAKILGAIAILIPGIRRLKEWAYAGFFFDLTGAAYSSLCTEGLKPQMAFFIVFYGFLFASYYFHLQKMKMSVASNN